MYRLYGNWNNVNREPEDSFRVVGDIIFEIAHKAGNHKLGFAMANEIIAHSYFRQGYFEKARSYYHNAWRLALECGSNDLRAKNLFNLGLVNVELRRPVDALWYLTEAKKHADMDKSLMSRILFNLGSTYKTLERYSESVNVYHTLLVYVQADKNRSWITSTLNNLGTLHMMMNRPDSALNYFKKNKLHHERNGAKSSLVIMDDYLNIAGAYTGLRVYDSAEANLKVAMDLAEMSKIAEALARCYSVKLLINEKRGGKATTNEYQQKLDSLDRMILGIEKQRKIKELEYKLDAYHQSYNNKLLQEQIDAQISRQRLLIIAGLLTAILTFIVFIILIKLRRTHGRLKESYNTIQQQREAIENNMDELVEKTKKLEELHAEKGALLSVVSHDLAGPFAHIKVWTQVMRSGEIPLNEEQEKALSRIESSVKGGEKLIRSILQVERDDAGREKLELERFNISNWIRNIGEVMAPGAAQKQIELIIQTPQNEIWWMGDKNRIFRICENLIFNAIKFSQPEKKIFLSLKKLDGFILIEIEDQGPGFHEDEMPNIFSKYYQFNNQPTKGENSTGLGLSIVKKLVMDLGGEIQCKSERKVGTCFTITFQG